jgi:hypothetical protein
MESRLGLDFLPAGLKEFWMLPPPDMEAYIDHMPAELVPFAKQAVINVENFYTEEASKMTPGAEQMAQKEDVLTWCNEVVEFLGTKAPRCQHAQIMSQIRVNCLNALMKLDYPFLFQ